MGSKNAETCRGGGGVFEVEELLRSSSSTPRTGCTY